MNDLANKKCVPCRGDVPPLDENRILYLASKLGGGWQVVGNHHLYKEYGFPDFARALEFTNRVGEVAEREGHHPDIDLSWGRVALSIWTHKIDGLTESDFILAAKVDKLFG